MKNEKTERTDTRARILEESAKLFADKGYTATGINEIAKRVGITKSVIYYHFHNKEDILHTLLQEAFDEFTQEARTDAHKKFHETGERFKEVMGMMEFMGSERNQRLIKIVLMESLKENTENNPLFTTWDFGLNTHRDFEPAHVQKLLAQDPLMMVKTFFMGFIPMISFFAFRERWCAHYNVSSEQAWDGMVEAMEECFTKLFRPQLWDK